MDAALAQAAVKLEKAQALYFAHAHPLYVSCMEEAAKIDGRQRVALFITLLVVYHTYKWFKAELARRKKVPQLRVLHAMTHDAEAVERALKAGGSANAVDGEGETALHILARDGGEGAIEDILKVMLKNGAKINGRNDRGGYAPLHYVAGRERKGIIDLFVKAGSDPKAPSIGRGTGFTPMHVAAVSDDVVMIDALVALGADVDAKSQDGSTPLHQAAAKGKIKACEALLRHKADCNAEKKNKDTPLRLAVTRNQPECTEMLIKAGAQVKQVVTDKLYKGGTLLHYACGLGFYKVVAKLLEGGADVRDLDDKGRTPLHLCAEHSWQPVDGFVESAKLLLNEGVDVWKEDLKGGNASARCMGSGLSSFMKPFYDKSKKPKK